MPRQLTHRREAVGCSVKNRYLSVDYDSCTISFARVFRFLEIEKQSVSQTEINFIFRWVLLISVVEISSLRGRECD